jgi:UrcA family protein
MSGLRGELRLTRETAIFRKKICMEGSIMKNFTFAATLVGSAFLVGSAAMPANPETPGKPVTVKFSDLDLSRPSDAVRLYDRIRKAAIRACQPFDSRSSYEQERIGACVKVAIARAVDSVGKQELYAVYQIKTGAALAPRLAALERR